MTLKDSLLQQAMQLFMKNGFSKYSDRELARALDVSISTFDEFFKGVDDLLMQALKYQVQQDRRKHEAMLAGAENAVEELLLLIQDAMENLKTVNPQYYVDLMNHKEAWKFVQNQLETYSYNQIYEILNKGVQQGLYMRDINLAIVTKVIIENVNVLLNTKVFPSEHFSLREVYRNIYLYYIRGLCTIETIQQTERIFYRTNLA